MKQEEFIESMVVNGKLVNIGLDDYGQCYFFEYYDEDTKQIETVCCGTYNSNYKEEVEGYFKTPYDHIKDILDIHREWIRELKIRVGRLEKAVLQPVENKIDDAPDEDEDIG